MKKLLVVIMSAAVVFGLAGCSAKQTEDKDTYTATVEAESAYIPSEISGKVTELTVKQGDNIKSGDKIGQIDTQMLMLQKKQAEEVLNIAKLKLDDLPSNVKDNMKQQAQAGVNQAQASVDILQLQINKAAIASETEGTISDVFVHKGEMAAAGTNIAKVINLKDKYIKLYIEESKRNSVKLGDTITVYSNDKKAADGKVVYIAPQSEFTPKNTENKGDKEKTMFEIKISLNNAAELVPGMMVDVVIK